MTLFEIRVAILLAMLVSCAAWGFNDFLSRAAAERAALYVQDKQALRYMGLPRPPQCGRFYNNGHHREWASCMGVGYNAGD